MKKFTLVLVGLVVLLPFTLTAQNVYDSFGAMSAWRAGSGDWAATNGDLIQRDRNAGIARVDRPYRQSGEVTVEFAVRYIDGGFKSEADAMRGHYHGGFGIHVGVRNPALGKRAWGNGESVLMWLNLDTRPETLRNYPEHYGFRAQIYRSTSNVDMDLIRDPALRPIIGTDAMTLDIIAALRDAGIMVTVDDLVYLLAAHMNEYWPIAIQFNTVTGDVWVEDPTLPGLWYWMQLDPSFLRGDYVALRTNSLSLGVDFFQARSR